MSAPILMWSVYQNGFVLTSNGTLWIATLLIFVFGAAAGGLIARMLL
jgi:hypothetical protein